MTSYPVAYALESREIGAFGRPFAPMTVPTVINNANERMAKRKHEVNNRFKKSLFIDSAYSNEWPTANVFRDTCPSLSVNAKEFHIGK